jgi:hypothetical protein
MNYLVANTQGVKALEASALATHGEPVIPNFPTGPINTFLGIETHKITPYATISDNPDTDLDSLVNRLAAAFPGLPKALLSVYVMATAMAAHAFPAGTVLQLFTDGEQLSVRPREGDKPYILWKQQPLPANIGSEEWK